MHKYQQATLGFLKELEQSLSADDRAQLRADLDSLGESWTAWRETHRDEIEQYAGATATMRAKRKTWQDPVHRRRLTLAAMYMHDKARHTLWDLAEFPMPGRAGPSYRDMSRYAAALFDRIRSQEIPDWPFDPEGNCTYS